jgi:hypothetical protein
MGAGALPAVRARTRGAATLSATALAASLSTTTRGSLSTAAVPTAVRRFLL